MTWGLVAVAGATVVGGYMASSSASDAAESAAQAQGQASDASIAESRRQFNAIQELLKPYTSAGTGALTGQQDLLGLNGTTAQQKAISGIASGPQVTVEGLSGRWLQAELDAINDILTNGDPVAPRG